MFKDLTNFKSSLEKIRDQNDDSSDNIIWKTDFGEIGSLDEEEESDRNKRLEIIKSIERLKKLKLGD